MPSGGLENHRPSYRWPGLIFMSLPFYKSVLIPGDCLLYFSHSLVDWAIALKSWTKTAHVEIYSGQGLSVASRNGIGVNKYPLRVSGICAVRRPVGKIDLDSANAWFEASARWQKYDWKGLLCFTLAVKQGAADKMFCSEFATRYYRHAAMQAFDPDWDADRVPPSFFLVSPLFETVWQDGELF